jgi:hypothetical protein
VTYKMVIVHVKNANPITLENVIEVHLDESYYFETGGNTSHEFPKKYVAYIKRVGY